MDYNKDLKWKVHGKLMNIREILELLYKTEEELRQLKEEKKVVRKKSKQE